ncbi:MAG: hypothetical protein RLZZ28_1374 [Bacteroidota bacterium]|jgi:hypothetical protein
MKIPVSIAVWMGCLLFAANAQQKLNPGQMNYLTAPKTNNIIYHDTVFTGSKQFKQLFFRTKDPELMYYFDKHQSNKIAGQILGIAGTVATIFGISRVTASGSDKGYGWALLGGGFAVTLTGSYLTLMAQRNLLTAITLFNQKNQRAAIGIGVSKQSAGLVYQF